MIVNVRVDGENEVGVLLCYDDPQLEEEEQEIPFIRWRKYLTCSTLERYIERMKLIIISRGTPQTITGLVSMKFSSNEKSQLRFMSESGERYNIFPVDDINSLIQNHLQSQTDQTLIPTWNGRNVVLTPRSAAAQGQEISGMTFVEDWVGCLCLSLFHTTKSFVDFVAKWDCEEEVLQGEISPKTGKRSPKMNEQLFWLWWPITKPRSLSHFLLKMRAEEKLDLRHFNEHFPLISGIYRVSIQKQVIDKDPVWTMKIHTARDIIIPIYFQEPEKAEEKLPYHPDFSDEARIIFNRNFALRYGYAEGFNVYGIFGSTTYVTAQLFPYIRDTVCPVVPCLSPWSSLKEFKSLSSKVTESPDEISGVIAHAKRLKQHLGLVFDELDVLGNDYFKN